MKPVDFSDLGGRIRTRQVTLLVYEAGLPEFIDPDKADKRSHGCSAAHTCAR